ncbi:DNA repair protein RadC [Candidatus Atribacteria bacterium 1244-E10-H5-B2]|nr:MAG: DNA repair protein RadC [Candidatus Atribacteria bacterium 1244-E10-H5-B2]
MYIKCEVNIKMQNSEIVADVFRNVLKNECEIDQQKEHFWVMGLTVKNKIIYLELISLGSLTEGIVHPREVFRSAIFKGVACLILCHNHPSGEGGPSEQDITVTKTLKEGGKILGIKILDHIILGSNDIFSFAKEGMLGG